MITTTLGKIADASAGMAAVMALPLPTVTSYRVSKLGKRVFAEAQAFMDQRNAAVRRLGTPIAGTDDFKFESPNKEVFTDEMTALSAVQVEIDAAPVSLKSLNGKDVAAAHLLALESAGLLIDDTENAT